jgi:ubiquinone/menaquinone biosynthesis C-methylase UbiE
MTADRSNYKDTWNALAQSMNSAKTAVSGFQDEEEYTRTALDTISTLSETVGVRKEDEILEIGCGVGRVGKELAPICRNWTGADISSSMIEFAQDRLQGIPNINLIELSDVGLTEFQDNSFDLVYCTVVFMHLFEWDRFHYIKEAHRVLRPDGRLFVDNIDIKSKRGHSMFMESYAYPAKSRPAHLSMVSSGDELESYFNWAGFQEVELHRWNDAWVGASGKK